MILKAYVCCVAVKEREFVIKKMSESFDNICARLEAGTIEMMDETINKSRLERGPSTDKDLLLFAFCFKMKWSNRKSINGTHCA